MAAQFPRADSQSWTFNSVTKVVLRGPHEGGQVGVASHQGDGLARGDVKVPGDLVEGQGAVDAASVVRLVRFGSPENEKINVKVK